MKVKRMGVSNHFTIEVIRIAKATIINSINQITTIGVSIKAIVKVVGTSSHLIADLSIKDPNSSTATTHGRTVVGLPLTLVATIEENRMTIAEGITTNNHAMLILATKETMAIATILIETSIETIGIVKVAVTLNPVSTR